jgi:hypothetical protein
MGAPAKANSVPEIVHDFSSRNRRSRRHNRHHLHSHPRRNYCPHCHRKSCRNPNPTNLVRGPVRAHAAPSLKERGWERLP